jgi:ribosome-associated heat shock protein Hsp15
MPESLRADKWLWAVRIFKTRALAAEACKGGKVKLNGNTLKPSRELKIGDEVQFKISVMTKTIRVIGYPQARIGAKLVNQFYEDMTLPEEYDKLKALREIGTPVFNTIKGRPTKRDRRKLNDLF